MDTPTEDKHPTPAAIADAVLDRVKTYAGVAFVTSSDYQWMFRDGKLLAAGSTVDADLALRALDIEQAYVESTELERDEVAAEEFDFLAQQTNHNYLSR